MKTHTPACAAAMAITLAGLPQSKLAQIRSCRHRLLSPGTLLCKAWPVLAERLALPYSGWQRRCDCHGGARPGRERDQGQALETINAQLSPVNLALRLSQGAQGQQLELAKTKSDSSVAHVIGPWHR
jgi:hypothetical protein